MLPIGIAGQCLLFPLHGRFILRSADAEQTSFWSDDQHLSAAGQALEAADDFSLISTVPGPVAGGLPVACSAGGAAEEDCLRRASSVYCVNSFTGIGTSAYVNVRCIGCCMPITEPGNWKYSLHVPPTVGTSVCTYRIPHHIY